MKFIQYAKSYIEIFKTRLMEKWQLDKYDPSGMYQVYDQWPKLAKEALQSDLESIVFKDIDHIVFAGMGGSGAVGDLFSSILSKSNIHVSLIKGYLLPKTVNKKTLVVAISISGNTTETMTVLKSAKKLDCHLIALSSGGKMEEFCKENNINYRKIKLFHSPRASFINCVYSIFAILDSILPTNKTDIILSIDELETLSKQISSNNLTDSNPAIQLANKITKIPLIYYPHGLQSVAIRFKSSLQENAKMHVIIEDIVEASHNGIMAWEKESIFQPILLRGDADYIKTKERFDLFKEYFSIHNIEFQEIHSIQGNILTKIITLIYLLDYTSIYRAILSEIDPTPVSSIDFLKSKI